MKKALVIILVIFLVTMQGGMAMANTTARIGIVPRGAYSSSTQYHKLDAINHEDASYLVLQDVIGVTPSDDGANYMVLSRSGNIRGTFASASELAAAYPSGNGYVYAVTADQNWYYHNGTAWTIGGSLNNNTALNNINTQLVTKANQTELNQVSNKVDSLVLESGTGDTEVVAARIDTSGNPSISAGRRIDNIENALINGSYIFKPLWSAGYINGTTGAEGNNSVNARTAIIHLKIGDVLTLASGCTVLVHIYVNGVWQSYQGLPTFLTNNNPLKADADVRFVFSYDGNPAITDYADMNNYLTITMLSRLSQIDDIKSSIATNRGNYENHGESMVVTPAWEYGYYSGTDGSKGSASNSIRTVGAIYLPKGSVITVGENGPVDIMQFDAAGNFVSFYTTLAAEAVYTLPEDLYVKLNWKYTSPVAITDVTIGNTEVSINKKSAYAVIKDLEERGSLSFWAGKKIAWFGTSIPAGNGELKYPNIIGEALGATLYNEAAGSSGVRAGHYDYVSEDDPMGYAGLYWESLAKSLSLSSTEKQDIFDNWATWQPIIPTAPETVPDAAAQLAYKNCSWDIKLAKYLTGGSVGQVDLYVFDHGHNDAGFGYDYDALNTIPTDPLDRKYFIGAMNFIIDKILSDNPKARICFIGHYENDRKTGISVAQNALADIWDFPLFKTWEKMGWSQKSVTSGGTTKTITQWWMPDDLHPHSDATGEATQHYADVLTPFIRDVR